MLQPARGAVVDRAFGDRQHRDDRDNAKRGGEEEDCRHAKAPAEPARQAGADHVAGVVPRLVAPFWALKPRWRTTPSVIPATAGPIAAPAIAVATAAGDNHEGLRPQQQERGQHRADAGDHHHPALVRRVIDERAGGNGHCHAGNPAGGHHLPIGPVCQRAVAGTRPETGRCRPACRP
jgi:hypothetical protein